MTALQISQKEFYHEHGYVIISNAVPQKNLDAAVVAISEFLGIDFDNHNSWYSIAPSVNKDNGDGKGPVSLAGMVELYQHQALWDNRQYPLIHQIFSDIWGTEKLLVTLDRVNMKPPISIDHPEWDHPGMIHWDINTSLNPLPHDVQGVLYLTDTTEEQGGFQCIPGFHKEFKEWVKTQPQDRDPFHPDIDKAKIKSIPGKAGDLLIWNSMLPHGNGANKSDRLRLAQYISMFPAEKASSNEVNERICSWRERRSTKDWPGDPRHWEQKNLREPAVLTKLGRRLLGIDQWY